MERNEFPDRHIKYQYSRRSKSGVVIQEPNVAAIAPAPTVNPPNADAPNADVPNPNPPPGFKCDPDQYMPIANVVRIMRRILPPHAKIADDAKETIQECVSEFISFITSEANEKCHREYRKTVTPEDVLSAMASLGFDNYVETLTLYLNKYRANDPDRGPIQHVPYVRRTPPSFVQRPMAQRPRPAPVPTPAPASTPAPPALAGYVPLPPTYARDECGYSELPPMTDFFMANQGGGEGTSREMEEFDPFN